MNEPEPQVLDRAVLAELRASVDGDRGFVVELIEAYLADGPGHVTAIDAAVDGGDADALVRPAHTLKSSSATVGAMQLAATARRLEMTGRSGTLDDATEADRKLVRSQWEAAAKALRDWIADGDAE